MGSNDFGDFILKHPGKMAEALNSGNVGAEPAAQLAFLRRSSVAF